MSTSSTDGPFSPATRSFLREAGQIVEQSDAGGVEVISDDFESRYEVRREDGDSFVVRRRARAAAPTLQVASSSEVDVQSWLMLMLRGNIRRSRGLLAAAGAPPTDDPAPGFTGDREGDELLVSDGSGPRMRFFRVARTDPTWVRWTHIANRPLEEIASRLTTEAGW